MVQYKQIDKSEVNEKLGAGEKVIVCDFKAMRCCECENMTLGAVRGYLERNDTVFFTKSEVE